MMYSHMLNLLERRLTLRKKIKREEAITPSKPPNSICLLLLLQESILMNNIQIQYQEVMRAIIPPQV